MPELNLDEAALKTYMFTGMVPTYQEYNIFLHCVVWTLFYTIWEFKLKKKLPSFQSFKTDYFGILLQMYKNSRELMFSRQQANFRICRDWFAIIDFFGDAI